MHKIGHISQFATFTKLWSPKKFHTLFFSIFLDKILIIVFRINLAVKYLLRFLNLAHFWRNLIAIFKKIAQAENMYWNSRDYYISIGVEKSWFLDLFVFFLFFGPQNPTKKLTHLVDLLGNLLSLTYAYVSNFFGLGPPPPP